MRLFIADEIEAGGPPDELMIRAVSSIHGETSSGLTALTEQRSRSWPDGTTFGTLVETIATEHGLEPAVAPSLAGAVLPHLDQVDEADINLLTRVARDRDAIVKPGGSRLVLAKRGASLTVSGQPMPVIAVRPRDVSTWRVRKALRPAVGRVVASYRDTGAGEPVEVTAGEGDRVRRLRQRFPDEASAQAAAEAEWRRGQREGIQLSVEMPGNPDAVAEARLRLSGFGAPADTDWLIIRATHTVDGGGYRTDLSCERLV
ncbi:contractile injection system protein, VgrG/Pvc8 family [Histidinibacterium aquaticum]|uniref:Late control protein D n=1 Tax=Histidinibacterium aquaticum TaxID=2613962 RepID=A0A5J5GRJ3_9RHOB|nr:contractile injection system protein, VgrG/Pvc8 family [Histidinibacterium aquaticum]KAA9010333.1 late control protein D [Histidinibacterium aquaticum]